MNSDFLFNDKDMVFRNGDFATGNSDNSNILDTLISTPGEWKENPLSASNIFSLINTTRPTNNGSILAPVVADGFSIDKIDRAVYLLFNQSN